MGLLELKLSILVNSLFLPHLHFGIGEEDNGT